MFWCVLRCRRSLQGIYSTLYSIKPAAAEHSARPVYSIQTATEEALDSTRPVYSIQAAIEEAADLLDQFTRSRQLQRRQQTLLDQFTRSRATHSTRLVDHSKRLLILLIPYSTRHLSIIIGEEEATTRPIDHSENGGRGADFAAPSLLDPQDRALLQTASSLLSSSQYRVFNILV